MEFLKLFFIARQWIVRLNTKEYLPYTKRLLKILLTKFLSKSSYIIYSLILLIRKHLESHCLLNLLPSWGFFLSNNTIPGNLTICANKLWDSVFQARTEAINFHVIWLIVQITGNGEEVVFSSPAKFCCTRSRKSRLWSGRVRTATQLISIHW